MRIRWITPLLGTAPALMDGEESGVNIIDVRELVDKPGNTAGAVRQKIVDGCESVRAGKKTVVCCDYGISRSNAVAVGIIAMCESLPFETALRRVLAATGENDIKIDPLRSVRQALGLDGDGNKKKTSGECSTRILVTGGTGHIGRPLELRLAERFTVFAPGRTELDVQQGSTQLDLFADEREIDCIIHLANPRVATSNGALGGTLTMLRNVLDVCVTRDIRLVHLSSSEVYAGYRSSALMADESLPLFPKGPYAETKYLCELLIEHSRRAQGLRCALLRSSRVYGGAGSVKPAFIYNFINKIRQSRRVVTHRYTNAVPALDLLYIDDLVTAVVQAADSEFCGNLNVGTGVLTSTRAVAEILRDVLGGRSEIESTLIDGDTCCVAMDAGKARDVLGWQPATGIADGLRLVAFGSRAA